MTPTPSNPAIAFCDGAANISRASTAELSRRRGVAKNHLKSWIKSRKFGSNHRIAAGPERHHQRKEVIGVARAFGAILPPRESA
jgi:hypothetical protein